MEWWRRRTLREQQNLLWAYCGQNFPQRPFKPLLFYISLLTISLKTTRKPPSGSGAAR